MPKADRISAPIPGSAASSHGADNTLVSIALFSGIGLLVSLIALILGLPMVWN